MLPIAMAEGLTAKIANARPKNAFERKPAIDMQNEETMPASGWMTRLTIM